eukprot:gene9318-11831_t
MNLPLATATLSRPTLVKASASWTAPDSGVHSNLNSGKVLANLAKLAIRVAALPSEVGERVKTHLAALHDKTEELAFVSDKGTTSRISEKGAVRVPGRKLDDVMTGAARVTLLKLDVEGAEANALRGAGRILREHRPLVMVCVYHGPTDLWDLPLLVDSWVP